MKCVSNCVICETFNLFFFFPLPFVLLLLLWSYSVLPFCRGEKKGRRRRRTDWKTFRNLWETVADLFDVFFSLLLLFFPLQMYLFAVLPGSSHCIQFLYPNRVKHRVTKRRYGCGQNFSGIYFTWADSCKDTPAKSSLSDCWSCPPSASASNPPASRRTSKNSGSKVKKRNVNNSVFSLGPSPLVVHTSSRDLLK